ncbi:TPA: transcriptional regulator CynR [Escherichia coli]|uniref:transcriptional regulator CynR n=1 Tax=Escherichia coli TaxID=562 RepID=UPI000B93E33C|nr:transcriptional regulator CynR [Escherichia coli]EFB6438766.1 transcriptional regulator CynR [Escherichia coli]EFC3464582.1 transcriptional regulator CynR [Escherichia coli]EFL7032905.1 transcriptional regulator CynR [Escherichia coli]EFL9929254.1 transcriptional regulator CynR [Escherichia coli]EFM0037315.1 transcriptional regulator CynR [Escherichia coli]
MLSRHINYFLAVAEHGSFTRAASALHVSQPALSQQIRQLEESLGVPLFDRSGRTIRLTDAGEVWRQYASRALQELGAGKRAIHDVADLTRGSLRIAVTPTFTSYFIGPLMADFYARYPGITLQLQEMSQEKIEDLLCRDELDVGIAFAPVHSPELEAIPLLTESLALSRLHDEKLVLLSAEFATREQIDHYCEKAGLHPQVVIEANSISAVLELIRRTSLSTLLPAAIATQHDGLKAISLAPPLLERTAVLLRRKNSWQTAAAKAFLHMALEECADVGENESR